MTKSQFRYNPRWRCRDSTWPCLASRVPCHSRSPPKGLSGGWWPCHAATCWAMGSLSPRIWLGTTEPLRLKVFPQEAEMWGFWGPTARGSSGHWSPLSGAWGVPCPRTDLLQVLAAALCHPRAGNRRRGVRAGCEGYLDSELEASGEHPDELEGGLPSPISAWLDASAVHPSWDWASSPRGPGEAAGAGAQRGGAGPRGTEGPLFSSPSRLPQVVLGRGQHRAGGLGPILSQGLGPCCVSPGPHVCPRTHACVCV